MNNFADFLPKYVQIKSDIANKIENGFYSKHQMLPSEGQLQKNYNVSRITIRKAMEELRIEGLIYKVQGRGTFIGNTAVRGANFSDRSNSCYKEIQTYGYVPKKSVLRLENVVCDVKLAQKDKLVEGEKYLIYERIYSGDEVPIAYIRSYYVFRYVQGIKQKDFTDKSVGQLIRDEYFYHLRLTRETILTAVLSNEEISRYMDLVNGHPIIHACITGYKTEINGIRGECIEKTYLYWRTDLLPIGLVE